jgi:uncharacterized protein
LKKGKKEGKQHKMSDTLTVDQRELLDACEHGDLATARHLVEDVRVDPNFRDPNGEPPLHVALLAGMDDVAMLLMNFDADKEAADVRGRTPLIAAAEGGCEVTTEELVESHVQLDVRDNAGRTALFAACVAGHWGVAQTILEASPNVNTPDITGQTPLMVSVRMAPIAFVEQLLARGADPNGRNIYNTVTPLVEACKRSNVDAMRALVRAGANVRVALADGITLLHHAALIESTPMMMRFLLRETPANLDVNTRDRLLRTPLHLAAEDGLWKNIVLLLKAGASPDVVDDRGLTPRDLAVASPHPWPRGTARNITFAMEHFVTWTIWSV